MRATRWQQLVVVALGSTVVVYALLTIWEATGGSPLPTPWTALVAMAAIAIAVVVVAWPVRRWTHGDRGRRLDPLRAARAAVLAKAASHCGALLVGWYAGQGLRLLADLGLEPRRDRFVVSLLAVVVAAGLVVAGQVAERWCRLPEDPDDRDDPGLGEPASGSRA